MGVCRTSIARERSIKDGRISSIARTTACTPPVRRSRKASSPGRGVALARASLILSKLKADNNDQRFGIEIIRKAI